MSKNKNKNEISTFNLQDFKSKKDIRIEEVEKMELIENSNLVNGVLKTISGVINVKELKTIKEQDNLISDMRHTSKYKLPIDNEIMEIMELLKMRLGNYNGNLKNVQKRSFGDITIYGIRKSEYNDFIEVPPTKLENVKVMLDKLIDYKEVYNKEKDLQLKDIDLMEENNNLKEKEIIEIWNTNPTINSMIKVIQDLDIVDNYYLTVKPNYVSSVISMIQELTRFVENTKDNLVIIDNKIQNIKDNVKCDIEIKNNVIDL